jgi:hypothetical protein
MRDTIQQRIQQLPETLRAKALDVVNERDRAYWFSPEWKSPTAVIDTFGGADLRWAYMQGSAAAHGTFWGMRWFRDQPDIMDVNPRDIGPRGLRLDLCSCRMLLETVRVRDSLELLDLAAEINELVAVICAKAQLALGA